MLLQDKNPHPRDKYVIFYEGPHKYVYIKNNTEFDTSVTTFIHSFVPSFDADKIIDLILNKKCRPQTLDKYKGMDKKQILEVWEGEKNLACLLGTRLHLLIEEYYNGIPLHIKDHELPAEFQYFKRFLKNTFLDQFIPYRTEWIVYDTELNIAGSIDMCFQNKDNGNLIIYDWKRSKEIKKNDKDYISSPLNHLKNCNYNTYSLQLNMYKYLLEKNYGHIIESMHLLVMHPRNNQYIQYDVPLMTKEVHELLQIRLEQNISIHKESSVEIDKY